MFIVPIRDALEKQSGRRRCVTGNIKAARGAPTRFRLYQAGKFGYSEGSPANLYQRSDYASHHFPEIVRRADSEKQQVTITPKLHIVDDYDRRAFLSPLVREPREVVPPG